jgi:hypothetical protein
MHALPVASLLQTECGTDSPSVIGKPEVVIFTEGTGCFEKRPLVPYAHDGGIKSLYASWGLIAATTQ